MERERDEKSDEHRRAAHSRAHNPLTSGSTAFLQVASERNVVASSLHHRRRRRRLYSLSPLVRPMRFSRRIALEFVSGRFMAQAHGQVYQADSLEGERRAKLIQSRAN